MDGTRPRRTRDAARLRWYARWRCRRFARLLAAPPAADNKDPRAKAPISRPEEGG